MKFFILRANFPLKSSGVVIGGGLALLGIEVTIGVVAEHCGGLTIPTVDHFPLINAGWPVAKTSLMATIVF